VANPRIAAALELAARRHELILAGEVEAFMALDDTLGAACAELLSAGADGLSAADIPELDELISLETQSRRVLETLMAEASARMAELARNNRANGAYLRHERLSVNGA
jgi:hypothetical protein